MALASLNKREKAIFYIAIIFLLLALAYRFLLEGSVKKWRELNREIMVSNNKYKKNLRTIQNEKIIKDAYQKYVNLVTESGSDEKKMASFLKEIENIASGTDVHIIDIKPLPVKEEEFFKKFLVELSAQGGAAQISKFIYNLQKSPQVIRVERLRLNAKSGEQNALQAQMSITRILIP